MKILFYCDEYPPAHHGGIGSVVKIVTEALAKKGHDIYIIGTYRYGHKLPHFSIINDVKIYRLTHFNYLKYIPKSAKRLVNKFLKEVHVLNFIAKKAISKTEDFIDKLVIDKGIDCMELVDYMELLQYLKEEIAFKRYQIPTLIRVHGSLSFIGKHMGSINPIWLKNDINNFDRCDKIIAVSMFSSNFVIEYLGIKRNNVKVIYNPIEHKFLSETPINKHNNNILFVGKITETKGVFSLIKAFNNIAENYPNYNLNLVGSGDISKAKSLIDPKLLHRVCFTGFINRNEINQKIDESIYCVIPTYFENFSMVALEIMARGKALIYSKRTSGPEIISHMVEGILVEPTDVEDLAIQMRFLLDNENIRYELGLAAHKKIKTNFLLDKIIIDLEETYGDSIYGNKGITIN
tara:strand:+ start:1672 stop:2889 length:1218 start_codon:yes stop_codon:yes gene_type:complete